MREKMAKKFS